MLSIDEAIEQFKTMANDAKGEIIKCDDLEPQEKYYNSQLELYIEEKEQLAEWLEELKAIKSDGFTDDLLNMGFTRGYNKAINDALSVVEWDGYTIDIKERIEQLKKI